MNSSHSRLVYVVDDDDAVRDSTRALLKSAGFAVREFNSGSALLGATHDRYPDAIVLDMDMPGMNGLELLDQLRARNCSAPIIFVTAADEELAQRIADADIVAVLSKPVSDHQLIHWVQQACTKR